MGTAPPLYIQEKVHPKVLIDDLLRRSKIAAAEAAPQADIFADFNGLPMPLFPLNPSRHVARAFA